jgi:hypothetical protein
MFDGCTRVLDVACGNGSFAIGWRWRTTRPSRHGLDYSQANIDRAREGAERRASPIACTFERARSTTSTRRPARRVLLAFAASCADGDASRARFDGLFVGEFVEHVANCTGLIDGLEAVLATARRSSTPARTAPAPRWCRAGCRCAADTSTASTTTTSKPSGAEAGLRADYFAGGMTERGNPIGNWLISTPSRRIGRPAATRPRSASADAAAPEALRRHHRQGRRARPREVPDERLAGRRRDRRRGHRLDGQDRRHREELQGHGARRSIRSTSSRKGSPARATRCSRRHGRLVPVDRRRRAAARRATGLRRYLDGPVFNGYVLQPDASLHRRAPTHDVPVRMFRTPARASGSTAASTNSRRWATQTRHPSDARTARREDRAHRLPDGTHRAEKRTGRNLPLLVKDQQVFPIATREGPLHPRSGDSGR